MLPRERVLNALDLKNVDKVPLQQGISLRGLYEHGEKLRELFINNPCDFENTTDIPLPVPDKLNFDKEGRYHELRLDDWGTLWEFRIFGMHGHPLERPLDDIEKLNSYTLPNQSVPDGELYELFKSKIAQNKRNYFTRRGWISIFERLIALRRFEDVLMDITLDTPEINKLTDMITAYHAEDIKRLIAAGVDCIQFGDDYGTQANLIVSPTTWRRFFKPRLMDLIKPVKDNGLKVLFHSCGMVKDIIDDLKEIGVDAIWPQMILYDSKWLSGYLREIKLGIAIHLDRANLMTYGNPDEIRRSVDMAVNLFRPYDGGSYFYIEVDNNFPYENIKALVEQIALYRR